LDTCDFCGVEVDDGELYRCYECGMAYCDECARKDGVIKEFGVCSDCVGFKKSLTFQLGLRPKSILYLERS